MKIQTQTSGMMREREREREEHSSDIVVVVGQKQTPIGDMERDSSLLVHFYLTDTETKKQEEVPVSEEGMVVISIPTV